MVIETLVGARRKNENIDTETLRTIHTVLEEINQTFGGILESTASASNIGDGVGVFDSKDDSVLQFRKLNGISPVITQLSGSTISMTLDQGAIDHTTILNTGTLSHTELEEALDVKEPAFEKYTAFNLDFGTVSGSVCEGNDNRLPPTTVGSPSGSFLANDNTWTAIDLPSPTKYETLRYELSGEISVGCLGHYMSERTQTVSSCRVGMLTAPSGSSIVIDLRKNSAASGSTILSAPIELAPPVPEVNGYFGVVESIDTEITEGDLLYVLITDVGSSIAGSDLMLQVVLEYA